MAHEFTQLQLKDADLLALLKTSGDNEDNQLQEEEDLVHWCFEPNQPLRIISRLIREKKY